MLKAPPLKSLDLHFPVIKCHCRTYDDNIGPKLKKLSFAILAMFDNKFDQYRIEVCPETSDIRGTSTFIAFSVLLSYIY